MSIIQTYRLTRKFRGITAVEDLSLEVAEGEVLGFLGPNGAGKTTTIRMLAGIISPSSGYALIAGRPTHRDVEQLHQIIGLLTESPGFYERLTAFRNLEYFAGFYDHLDIPAQVEKYLETVGLWERRNDRVGTFSKGMKHRLALARALVHEPRVLFLDEPTAGLDPEAAREVRELIKQLSRQGRTIFLSTHNLEEAEQLCKRVAVISTRLLALDTPDRLRRSIFRRQLIVRLQTVQGIAVDSINNLPFVLDVEKKENELLVELADPDLNRPALVKAIVELGGAITEVTEKKHSLEEVYLNLIQEEGSRETQAYSKHR